MTREVKVLDGKVTSLELVMTEDLAGMIEHGDSNGIKEYLINYYYEFSRQVFDLRDRMPVIESQYSDNPFIFDSVDKAQCFIEKIPRSNNIGFVYVVNFSDGIIKIGKTSHPQKRVKEISNGRFIDSNVFYFTPNYHKLETELHTANKEHLVNGEYYNRLSEEVINILCNIREIDIYNGVMDTYAKQSTDSIINDYTYNNLIAFINAENHIINNLEKLFKDLNDDYFCEVQYNYRKLKLITAYYIALCQDELYGSVKAYHKDVWLEAYALTID